METSESITKIAPALIKAQAAIRFAVKDHKNPHYKSMYADLASVITACKEHLIANDIGVVQLPSMSDGDCLCLTTRLIHASGEWIEDTATCPLPKHDPQGFGSAMTYLRRYSLAAAVMLYQDDDDGNSASATTSTPKPVAVIAPKAPVRVMSDDDFTEHEDNIKTAASIDELRKAYMAAVRQATKLKDEVALKEFADMKDEVKAQFEAEEVEQ